MALKAKIANKVQTNTDGMIEGTIVSVLEIEERFEDVKGNVVSEDEYKNLKNEGKKVQKFVPQFEFRIETEGTQKSVIYSIWTGQIINDEKYEKDDKSIDYNNLTRLLLCLELITEKQLKDLDGLEDFNLEGAEGLKIQFELEAKKGKSLKVPKLKSIKPVKVLN